MKLGWSRGGNVAESTKYFVQEQIDSSNRLCIICFANLDIIKEHE